MKHVGVQSKNGVQIVKEQDTSDPKHAYMASSQPNFMSFSLEVMTLAGIQDTTRTRRRMLALKFFPRHWSPFIDIMAPEFMILFLRDTRHTRDTTILKETQKMRLTRMI